MSHTRNLLQSRIRNGILNTVYEHDKLNVSQQQNDHVSLIY